MNIVKAGFLTLMTGLMVFQFGTGTVLAAKKEDMKKAKQEAKAAAKEKKEEAKLMAKDIKAGEKEEKSLAPVYTPQIPPKGFTPPTANNVPQGKMMFNPPAQPKAPQGPMGASGAATATDKVSKQKSVRQADDASKAAAKGDASAKVTQVSNAIKATAH